MIDGSPARLLQALHGRPFAAAAVVAVVHDRHEHLDAAYSPDRRLVGSVAVLAHDRHERLDDAAHGPYCYRQIPQRACCIHLACNGTARIAIAKCRNASAAFALPAASPLRTIMTSASMAPACSPDRRLVGSVAVLAHDRHERLDAAHGPYCRLVGIVIYQQRPQRACCIRLVACSVAVVHDRHERLDGACSPDRRLVGSVAVLAHDHHHSMPPTARIVALLASSSINKGRNAPAAFA